MPNWCETTYKIVGRKEELDELYDILKRMQSRKAPVIENDFGNMWLGELINELGYYWNQYTCRGVITGFNYDSDIITIDQDTAWHEQSGVRMALKSRFPSVNVYYLDIEPGCEYYCTNDDTVIYFKESYYLEAFEEDNLFIKIKEVASYVERNIGKPVEPTISGVRKALCLYKEERENEGDEFYYRLEEIKYCND